MVCRAQKVQYAQAAAAAVAAATLVAGVSHASLFSLGPDWIGAAHTGGARTQRSIKQELWLRGGRGVDLWAAGGAAAAGWAGLGCALCAAKARAPPQAGKPCAVRAGVRAARALLTPLPLPPLSPPLCVPTQSANALTFDELQGLTYLQVKGSGIANTCPVLESGTTNLGELKAGSYKLEKFCIEPTSFTVKEESQFKGGETEFVKTKLMTRLTYTLDAMSGTLKVGSDGSAVLKEDDGIDYAATTVQLPGGERVAFLFTIKQFDGKGTLDNIAGDFVVPSYRGATFLDPKVRLLLWRRKRSPRRDDGYVGCMHQCMLVLQCMHPLSQLAGHPAARLCHIWPPSDRGLVVVDPLGNPNRFFLLPSAKLPCMHKYTHA